ncbi:MAG: MFS transporter [Acidobacteriota bacterium]
MAVQKPTRIRFVVLAALFGLAAFTYLDRVCMSIAAPWITRDLKLSPEEMGTLFSVFAAAYALFGMPTGWCGDRLGPRRMLSFVLGWWSIFTAAIGFVGSFTSMLTVQFLFGAGEAGAYPNMTRSVTAWFPPRGRGFAMGTVWMGSRLGAAITPPIVLFLIHLLGWRETFRILGISGGLLAVAWFVLFRDHPSELPCVNAAERELIAQKDAALPALRHEPVPLGRILLSKNLWALDLMYFTLGFTYYLYISWLPSYLVKRHGVSLHQLAFYAALPLAFSAAAALMGGVVTDSLVPYTGLKWARRAVGMAGSAAAATCLFISLHLNDVRGAVLFISLAAAAGDFVLAAAWASCADIGESAAGTVSGAMNMIGNVGATASPILMGFLIERTGNWNLTFYIAAALNLAGLVFWLGIDAGRKLLRESAAPA